ncbi:MAG: vWA domain-containing protein [Candidatus Bathyarchaeia archaeon]
MTEIEEASISFINDFVPEFIAQMRKSPECSDKPSPRQSIRMSELLLHRYLKRGRLSFEDFVEVAVVTSRPDDQDLAMRIAWEVLAGKPQAPDRGYDFLFGAPEEILSAYLDAKERADVAQKLGEEPEETLEDVLRYYLTEEDLKKLESILNLFNLPAPGVGTGEDKLLKAFLSLLKWGARAREKELMKDVLKNKLIRLGWRYERMSKMTVSRHLRPYEPGEDPDLIDEEKSLEHILIDQGKEVDEIVDRDFLMRKRERKRKTIIYLYDISNTMQDDLAGGGSGINSLQYAAMSLIPLLWIFRKEKYGVAFFESNTHIIKDLLEDRDEDNIIDIILDTAVSNSIDLQKSFLSSRFQSETRVTSEWGGTVPNSGLRWASEQLRRIRDRSTRICYLFTDAIFEDPEATPEEAEKKAENYEIIRDMVNSGIRVFVCLSPVAYEERHKKYVEPTTEKLKETGCGFLLSKDPREFLESLMNTLERPIPA